VSDELENNCCVGEKPAVPLTRFSKPRWWWGKFLWFCGSNSVSVPLWSWAGYRVCSELVYMLEICLRLRVLLRLR